MISLFFQNVLIIWIFMTTIFVVAITLRNNGIVDTAWGIGFLIIAISGYRTGEQGPRQLIVVLLVTLWALRLAIHILARSRGKAEDRRYKELRDRWGSSWILQSYLYIFLMQGLWMLIVALPIMAIHTEGSASLTTRDYIAIALWICGFLCESLADKQLSEFKKNPENRGEIMRTGLWQYSRHPNYFGELTMWWSIWLLSLGSTYGPLSVIGPLLLTVLITKITGIPPLEKKYEGNPDFDEYKSRTNALIPWFPAR